MELPPYDAEAELEELKQYLGDAYQQEKLEHSEEEVEKEFTEARDEDRLYRTSEAYLYDLTAFAMSETKTPYLETLTRYIAPGARLLDYGCGIGSDGLRLLEAGYDVAFAEFDNPSARYLRWRLERRGVRAPVYDLDRSRIPPSFELAYAFDVIEHVDDPLGLLSRLESVARNVLVNFLGKKPGDTALHHRELPIPALLRHSASRGLRCYRRYHGRSHLVLYASDPGGRLGRVRSLAHLSGGRARSLLAERS